MVMKFWLIADHGSLLVLMASIAHQVNVFKSSPQPTAGSSSPVFTTSGVSSWMYRCLTNFASPPNTALDSENALKRNRLGSNSKCSSVEHQLSKQLEVTVHTAYEEHQMSHQTHCDAYPGSDGQLADKPDEVSVDGKVEGREGKTRRAIIDIPDSMNV